MPDTRPENSPGKGEKRRRAMIEAANALFMEKGYAAVSLDEIIRVSKGSKSSLYKFFGNKEGILKAVVEALAEDMLRKMSIDLPSGKSPREGLHQIGMVLAEMALSENAINQHRHAASHARTFPEVARLWYESGPRKTFDGIADYLAKEKAAGRLRMASPRRAAVIFAGMIAFEDNMRMLIGLPPPKKSELEELVSEAVEVFLAAYGTG